VRRLSEKHQDQIATRLVLENSGVLDIMMRIVDRGLAFGANARRRHFCDFSHAAIVDWRLSQGTAVSLAAKAREVRSEIEPKTFRPMVFVQLIWFAMKSIRIIAKPRLGPQAFDRRGSRAVRQINADQLHVFIRLILTGNVMKYVRKSTRVFLVLRHADILDARVLARQSPVSASTDPVLPRKRGDLASFRPQWKTPTQARKSAHSGAFANLYFRAAGPC
jgi:hypothetical protein